MNIMRASLTSLFLCLALSLAGCKKAVDARSSAASSAASAGAAMAPASAPAPAVAAAAGTQPAAPEAPAFDFNTIAESTATIPPFPYIDYPPKVTEAFQSTRKSPLDEIYVILGNHLHRLEGSVQTSTFDNRNADMSELEVRRNYENAIKGLGGVKVNTVAPDDKAFLAASGNEQTVQGQLRFFEAGLSYDVYLIRKGPVRRWIVLMVNDRRARLLSIEEKAFVQTIGYVDNGGNTQPVTATGAPPASAQPVDLNAIAVSASPLPPFPYLAYPPEVHEAFQETRDAKFDAVSVIVGNHVQPLEGRVETRSFLNRNADMSPMALRRNYEAAVKGLGGVKVNSVAPEDPTLIAANGNEIAMREKLRILEANMSYDSYLIRTPEKRAWIVLMFDDSKTRILTVEEKAFVQSVALISADTMRTELAAKGRIALYVNFNTDQATIRADGKPTVDEIVMLMKKDSALKLAIEGHTDNSGDAKHNKELSQHRADAVMNSLVTAGIAKARLSASGLGDARPLVDNKDEAGRAKNRRVELVKAP